MTRLTEEMVIARTRANDLANIRKLNVWGSGLSDVTLLRKMQNVEILSLSVNKINTLEDFQWCRNLQELYVRRNEIKDLNQVCYLRDLPRLRSLWLDENPCAACDLYRVTVLRALPHLQKLDNVPVAPEEVQEALRRGLELCHPEEAKQSPAPAEPHFNSRASPPSPLRSPPRHEEYNEYEAPAHNQHEPPGVSYYGGYEDCPSIPRLVKHSPQTQHPQRRHGSLSSLFMSARGGGRPGGAPSDPESEPDAHHPSQQRRTTLQYDDEYQDQRNANCHDNDNTTYGRTVNNQYHNSTYEETTPGSAEEYAAARRGGVGGSGGSGEFYSSDGSTSSNGHGSSSHNGRGPPSQHHMVEDERGEEREVYGRPAAPSKLQLLLGLGPGHGSNAAQRCSLGSQASLPQMAPSQQGATSNSTRRPVARNSNILSAVLCLIKELDFPSLEVVEVAVRSRMEEF